TDDVGGWAVDPRNLGTHATPFLVGAPQQRRQPGKTGLAADDLQSRKLLKYAFGDEADQHVLERRAVGHIVLDLIGRPTRVGGRTAKCTAGVERHWELVAFGRLVDRPITAITGEHIAHNQHQALYKS